MSAVGPQHVLHDGAVSDQLTQYQFETNNRDPWHHRDEGGTTVPSKADEARLVRCVYPMKMAAFATRAPN